MDFSKPSLQNLHQVEIRSRKRKDLSIYTVAIDYTNTIFGIVFMDNLKRCEFYNLDFNMINKKNRLDQDLNSDEEQSPKK